MLRNLVVFLFLLMSSTSTWAQLKSFKGALNPYPLEDGNVLLLNRDLLRNSSGDLALEFSLLDNDFNEIWKNFYPFSKGLSPVFQKITSEGILLLFTDSKAQNYELVMANLEDGSFMQSSYNFTEPFDVSEAEFYYDNVWVSGAIGGKPAVFKLETNNRYSTLPVGLRGLVKYAGSIKFNKSRKALDFLLLAETNKQDILVWRSVSAAGELIASQTIDSFGKKEVRSIKGGFANGRAVVTGIYGIKNKPKNEGIYFAVISEDAKILYRPFKENPDIISYKRITDIEKKGFSASKTVKYKLPSRQIYIDDLVFDEDGVWVAYEVYGTEFRNRGVLEQQFISRDRTAQIDQNTYGFRNGLGGSTVADRMETYSATDQLQYNFMNQSLGKAIREGIRYNHTSFIQLKNNSEIMSSPGVWFNIDDGGRLAETTQMGGEVLAYSDKNRLIEFDYKNNKLRSIDGPDDTLVLAWQEDYALGFTFVKDAKLTKLSKIKFE